MKKRLLSIIAIILCFCTVLALASCGNKNTEEDLNATGENGDASDNASLEGSESTKADGTKESDKANNNNNNNNNNTNDPDGIKDADAATKEAIFTQMKADYNATVGYTGAYEVTSSIKTETTTTTKDGDATETSTDSSDITDVYTADPAAIKYLNTTTTKKTSTGADKSTDEWARKIYSENSNGYVYEVNNGEGAYSLLSSTGLSNVKSDEMPLKNVFLFYFECYFGNPFSASNASNLKTTTSKILNEVKANTSSVYKAGTLGTAHEKADCTADSNIIINKIDGTNVLKRTISYTISLEYKGGIYKEDATIESLLKTKDGKLLSFEVTTTRNTTDDPNGDYNSQENYTSTVTYDFKYTFNSASYDKVTVSTPTSDVPVASDYFETPITLVIAGNEITVNVNALATDLQKHLTDYVLSGNETTWYKDSAYTTPLDFTTLTTVDSLKGLKIYSKGFELGNDKAIAIEYGSTTLNINADYKTVFGELTLPITGANEVTTKLHEIDTTASENNIKQIGMHSPAAGYSYAITLNGSLLDNTAVTEFNGGEFCWDSQLEGGKTYFVKHSVTIGTAYFMLGSFLIIM